MSDLLANSIQRAMETKQSSINTTLPGKIISYDPATNRATVQPSIPRRMADGTEVLPSIIHQVPVMFPASGIGGKQATMTFPIAPGDGVMLSFQQRCTEDWRSGKNTAPTDGRQYSLSDCVATPGLNASGVAGDPENVVLRFDQSTITLRPDNSITMGNENGSITITPAGEIILRGTSVIVEAAGKTVVVEQHGHTLVTAGFEMSGPPP